jgi:amidase
MKFPEYEDFDATALAELVRTGQVTPHELLEAAIERIETYDPSLNAVVDRLYDRAHQKVNSLPSGPFRGVPFLVKNLLMTIKGTATSDGNRLKTQKLAPQNSLLAKRYESAGLQIIGKTNVPEFGILGTTEPRLYGPCRNPWNPEHSAGGSSGGSAAAVAARMVPMAHGGDGGGSIRIPASACGLFGLKPTRGRVSLAPLLGEGWNGFVQEHVLTRSVRDSAAMLDIASVPVAGDPYAAPHQPRPWISELIIKPGKLRIAYTSETLLAGTTHPDCQLALQDAITLLRELGHTVEEARPAFSARELSIAYLTIVACNIACSVAEAAQTQGRPPSSRDFEGVTWFLSCFGRQCSGADFVAAQTKIHAAARALVPFFSKYDLLITPTLACPPVRIGELDPSFIEAFQLGLLSKTPSKRLMGIAIERIGSYKLAPYPNTQLCNMTGQPAMSVPLYWNEKGLPIGIHFIGRFGDEATLFRLARQLEVARPWSDKKPKLPIQR